MPFLRSSARTLDWLRASQISLQWRSIQMALSTISLLLGVTPQKKQWLKQAWVV
jgi:hypothetical protein